LTPLVLEEFRSLNLKLKYGQFSLLFWSSVYWDTPLLHFHSHTSHPVRFRSYFRE